jgi:hypothetical protein
MGEFERGDPRVMINTPVLSIYRYERMHMALVHLTGGQQRSHNPDYDGEPEERPPGMIATELEGRGRLVTILLMSDVLHCVVLATNFPGCEELLDGEEKSRQLLLCQRNFTENRQSIDIPFRFFAELPSSRTDFQPSFPYGRTGTDYAVYVHLNLMLGDTQPDIGTMVEKVIHQTVGCHIKEITDSMITAGGFTLTLTPHNPEALTDHWVSDDFWLAHHDEGDDMLVAQLTLIAGPKHS